MLVVVVIDFVFSVGMMITSGISERREMIARVYCINKMSCAVDSRVHLTGHNFESFKTTLTMMARFPSKPEILYQDLLL